MGITSRVENERRERGRTRGETGGRGFRAGGMRRRSCGIERVVAFLDGIREGEVVRRPRRGRRATRIRYPRQGVEIRGEGITLIVCELTGGGESTLAGGRSR